MSEVELSTNPTVGHAFCRVLRTGGNLSFRPIKNKTKQKTNKQTKNPTDITVCPCNFNCQDDSVNHHTVFTRMKIIYTMDTQERKAETIVTVDEVP